MRLTEQQMAFVRYVGPALFTGAVAWVAFMALGSTPMLRASGLAAAVVGVSLTLRRMGALMSFVGGMALVFSPAFWAQTGGTGSSPATIVLALGAASVFAVLLVILVQRPYIAMFAALIIFAAVFISQIGEARSLRLTVLASAWLIYLLVQAVVTANPRPDEPPRGGYRLAAALRAGILLILVTATINDPLFVLFVPAVTLGLLQSQARIPAWYWAIVAIVAGVGLYGVYVTYISPNWWGVTVETAMAARGNVPYLIADGWWDGGRWIATFARLASQFSFVGLLLSVVGLARLARWYPPVGTVMMVGYAAFFAFGLAYFGRDRTTLLIPLLMMQVFLMCYAVHAAGQWAAKAFQTPEPLTARLIAPAVFAVLPAFLFIRLFTS
jgi:hypothetical protein